MSSKSTKPGWATLACLVFFGVFGAGLLIKGVAAWMSGVEGPIALGKSDAGPMTAGHVTLAGALMLGTSVYTWFSRGRRKQDRH